MLIALFFTLGSLLIFLVLNGHFLPVHFSCTTKPKGSCCVTCSVVSVNLVFGLFQLQKYEMPDASVGNGSAIVSQFSSTLLPLISLAFGRMLGSLSLQSCRP